MMTSQADVLHGFLIEYPIPRGPEPRGQDDSTRANCSTILQDDRLAVSRIARSACRCNQLDLPFIDQRMEAVLPAGPFVVGAHGPEEARSVSQGRVRRHGEGLELDARRM